MDVIIMTACLSATRHAEQTAALYRQNLSLFIKTLLLGQVNDSSNLAA